MKVRRSKMVSGSGTRSAAGRVVALERRCSALEHGMLLLTVDERLRQLARRVATLEEDKQTA